jgi:hypothetical protein
MNKIGILTFHRSHNCGSILQAYAMQETLKQYDCDPTFIDLSTDGQSVVYAIFKRFEIGTPKTLLKSMYKNTLGTILYFRLKDNQISYKSYIQKHLKLSRDSYRTSSDITDSDGLLYDKYLTGSDQVWNITIADYDSAYFLDFVKRGVKIAYAVSQGAKDINKYAENPKKIARWIKDIDWVSTREDNGQKWLTNLTGAKYPIVLDPTLLHDQDIYASVLDTHKVPGIIPGQYIFIYATPLNRDYLSAIRKYAKENNLEIVMWHNDAWLRNFGWLKGIKCPKKQNPGKYLDLIKNAKIICTSSFHGVAFSTIYRKNFVVLKNDGMRADGDDRMTGFLKRLKLSDRIVDLNRLQEGMNRTINYTAYGAEIKKQQIISHKFLRQALSYKSNENE